MVPSADHVEESSLCECDNFVAAQVMQDEQAELQQAQMAQKLVQQTSADLSLPLLNTQSSGKVTNNVRRSRGCCGMNRRLGSFKIFWGRVRLALLVSVCVTLFSSPVFVPKLDGIAYGDTSVCEPQDVFWKELAPADNEADGVKIWCGYMPRSYKVYWPNVVQLIIFTVYQTTGQTVQLAWQGVAGTFCACVNIFFMCWLYPCGASDPSSRTDCDPYGPSGDGYIGWVAWVDLIVVIFLFLISNAEENSMKFGLSWHLFFMMNYMNPNVGPTYGTLQTGIKYLMWDSQMCIVMMTSVVGATIAIFATLVPCPLLNTTRIDDDAVAVQKAMDGIWTEALAYFCGTRYQSRHHQIEAKISSLSSIISTIKTTLDRTWWETFDIACFGSRRRLYLAFSDLLSTLDDVMYAVKASIHAETFQGNHNEFCSMLKPHMFALKTEAGNLLFLCAEVAADGRISKSEVKDLRSQQELVRKRQASLFEAFNCVTAGKNYEYVSLDMADEYAFVFALSAWARCIEDYAVVVDKVVERRCCLCGPFQCVFRLIFGLVKSLFSIFTFSCLTNKDRRSFAIRNTLTITLCFVIGFNVDTSVFTRYNPTMATTVALLVSHSPGSVFQKNLQRLLGLSLGKVLPLLVMAAVAQTGCYTVQHSVAHASGIFIYMFGFTYMFYSSLQWSYVGCVIAGFGCYGLLVPCNDDTRSTFGSRYSEIGQVTFAIVMQLVVDGLFCLPSPRDLATQKVMMLNGAFTRGYEGFFKGDLQQMVKQSREIETFHLEAVALSHEVDPKLSIVQGKRTPFRNELYTDVLTLMRLVRSDFQMLIIAMKDWTAAPVPRSGDDVKRVVRDKPIVSPLLVSLSRLEAMRDSRNLIMEHLYGSLLGFREILAHDREEPIMSNNVNAIHRFGGKHTQLDHSNLVDQINASHKDFKENGSDQGLELTSERSVRLAVSLRALDRSVAHLGMIDQMLLQQDIF
eukprot:TRINITY_DN9180_c0_g2_i1.p1 TRINITY_DN9180_c0_g2~~TRINITY_DN9180_c0_g2_i1.p1  ORF type:complete len:1066 (-),score=177.26 TRINITY_DN9180_c0_g2_i1:131-3028(-)